MVKDVSDLKNVTLSKLISINGIGAVKAIDFLAALELGRRVYDLKPLDDCKDTSIVTFTLDHQKVVDTIINLNCK